MVRVGSGLRSLRENLGQSLEDVSRVTRLRRDWLFAIETMNVKLLPSSSVLNNYLSGYAKHLGLDPRELVSRFELQCGAISEAEETEIDTTPRDRLPAQVKWASIAAGALLVIGGMATFGVRILNPDQGNMAVVTADATRAEAPVYASRPLFDDAKLAAIDAQAVAPLEIVALRKAWIEVRGADGTVFRQRVMSPGETYRPRLRAGWTVNARDGGAFAWKMDGIIVAPLGEDSTPVFSASVDAAAADAIALVQPMTASVAEGSPSR